MFFFAGQWVYTAGELVYELVYNACITVQNLYRTILNHIEHSVIYIYYNNNKKKKKKYINNINNNNKKKNKNKKNKKKNKNNNNNNNNNNNHNDIYI